eukprot:2677504-Pleurochrysis_carterae.AAC.1
MSMSCAGRCAGAPLLSRVSSAARPWTRGSGRFERLRVRRGAGFASSGSPLGSPGSASGDTAASDSGARLRSDAKRRGVLRVGSTRARTNADSSGPRDPPAVHRLLGPVDRRPGSRRLASVV